MGLIAPGIRAIARRGFHVTMDVKCAGCNSYFPLSKVVQEGNGYYCKKCIKKLREGQQRDAVCETKCIFCNMVLHEGNWNTFGGYRYCNDCLKTIAGKSEQSRAYKCSVCGRLLYSTDTRMVRDGKEFCEKCYHRAFDEERNEKVYKCSICGKQMGPLEVKMRAGQNYCEKCYGEAEDIWEKAIRELFHKKEGNVSSKDYAKITELKGKVIQGRDGNLDQGGQTESPGDKKENRTPETVYADTAQLFKCLGDPCRVKIIESLADHSMSVFAFVDLTGYQYSAISYHLKMLKEMSIVDSHRDGNFQVYSLTDKGVAVHEFIRKSASL